MSMHRCTAVILGVTALSGSHLARGDSQATMSTRPASSTSMTAEVTLSTNLGGGTDSDTQTIGTTGSTFAVLSPTAPPWNQVTFDPFQISVANATYNFQFNIFLMLTATVSNFQITAVGPLVGTIDPSGNVTVTGGQFHATGNMHVTGLGGLVNVMAPIDTISINDFSGRIIAVGPNVVFDQKMITPIVGSVPPEQLPSGVNSVDFIITVNLTNTVFEGAYSSVVTCDSGSYATLHACMSGPDAAFLGDCSCVDFDADGDVDLVDYVAFQ